MEGGDIMKKVVKCLLLFTLCFLLLFSSTSFADSPNIEKVTSTVYGLLFKFGVILAVCLTATLAISYMVATPNKKAMLKERLIYYFAGVAFLVGGLAFLNIYESVSDDVGDTVYSTSAPTKIKNYFKNQITTSSGADDKSSVKNAYDKTREEVDDMADKAITEGITSLTEEEIDVLIIGISGLDENIEDDFDVKPLLNIYDTLSPETQSDIYKEAQLLSQTYSRRDEMTPAIQDLIDFYKYKSGEGYGFTDDQWETDTYLKENYQWYYENVYLKNKE